MSLRAKTRAVYRTGSEQWLLPDAVDKAQMVWRNAQQLVDLAEERDVEEAIYYLHLTEKRYMYLLQKTRQMYAGEER